MRRHDGKRSISYNAWWFIAYGKISDLYYLFLAKFIIAPKDMGVFC
jgi:hypothetical protein